MKLLPLRMTNSGLDEVVGLDEMVHAFSWLAVELMATELFACLSCLTIDSGRILPAN